MSHAATHSMRGPSTPNPRISSAFLPVEFSSGAAHLSAALGAGCPLSPASPLPYHHSVHQISSYWEPEDMGAELNRADLVPLQRGDRDFEGTLVESLEGGGRGRDGLGESDLCRDAAARWPAARDHSPSDRPKHF